jgi:putative ABC transport system permease protein
MLARDVLAQATFEALGRPWRTLLTVVGTILGVGMFVATLGVTDTAQSQINQRFDVLVSTEVDVQDAHPDDGIRVPTAAGEQRAARLPGVLAAGLLGQVDNPPPIALSAPGSGVPAATDTRPVLLYADTGALRVLQPSGVRGRLFDSTQLARGAHVALLGAGAARALGLSPDALPAALYVGGARFVVEGVVGDVRRHREALAAVILPQSAARATLSARTVGSPDLLVATRLGYAGAVGRVLAGTVSPVDPDRVAVLTPPDPSALRGQVAADLSGLFIVLGGVGLLVGIIGIGNTTLVSVLERVQEIGLRRALGARRGQIALQFLLESLAIGTVGGLLGAGLGSIGVTAIAVTRGWTPVLPLWLPICAPLLGTVAGLVAGCYPALRAARVDPVSALTS